MRQKTVTKQCFAGLMIFTRGNFGPCRIARFGSDANLEICRRRFAAHEPEHPSSQRGCEKRVPGPELGVGGIMGHFVSFNGSHINGSHINGRRSPA